MEPEFVIAVGNAFDGLQLVGPFSDPEEAGDYAQLFHRHDVWEIIQLCEPETER